MSATTAAAEIVVRFTALQDDAKAAGPGVHEALMREIVAVARRAEACDHLLSPDRVRADDQDVVSPPSGVVPSPGGNAMPTGTPVPDNLQPNRQPSHTRVRRNLAAEGECQPEHRSQSPLLLLPSNDCQWSDDGPRCADASNDDNMTDAESSSSQAPERVESHGEKRRAEDPVGGAPPAQRPRLATMESLADAVGTDPSIQELVRRAIGLDAGVQSDSDDEVDVPVSLTPPERPIREPKSKPRILLGKLKDLIGDRHDDVAGQSEIPIYNPDVTDAELEVSIDAVVKGIKNTVRRVVDVYYPAGQWFRLWKRRTIYGDWSRTCKTRFGLERHHVARIMNTAKLLEAYPKFRRVRWSSFGQLGGSACSLLKHLENVADHEERQFWQEE